MVFDCVFAGVEENVRVKATLGADGSPKILRLEDLFNEQYNANKPTHDPVMVELQKFAVYVLTSSL